MAKAILLAVDDEAKALEGIERELRKRYGGLAWLALEPTPDGLVVVTFILSLLHFLGVFLAERRALQGGDGMHDRLGHYDKARLRAAALLEP